jgi:hypothetical protein
MGNALRIIGNIRVFRNQVVHFLDKKFKNGMRALNKTVGNNTKTIDLLCISHGKYFYLKKKKLGIK